MQYASAQAAKPALNECALPSLASGGNYQADYIVTWAPWRHQFLLTIFIGAIPYIFLKVSVHCDFISVDCLSFVRIQGLSAADFSMVQQESGDLTSA